MSPGEMKQQRERLGLTQKQVANALRISEFTLSRWETGAQIQQRCMDTFLRAFFDLGELRSYLGIPEPAWSAHLDRGLPGPQSPLPEEVPAQRGV